jgi:hypothetical protein
MRLFLVFLVDANKQILHLQSRKPAKLNLDSQSFYQTSFGTTQHQWPPTTSSKTGTDNTIFVQPGNTRMEASSTSFMKKTKIAM